VKGQAVHRRLVRLVVAKARDRGGSEGGGMPARSLSVLPRIENGLPPDLAGMVNLFMPIGMALFAFWIFWKQSVIPAERSHANVGSGAQPLSCWTPS